MRRQLLTFSILILFIRITYGQNKLTLPVFESFCDSSGLKFNMLEGYKINDVKENRNLEHSFS
jgi:hypothetical protein